MGEYGKDVGRAVSILRDGIPWLSRVFKENMTQVNEGANTFDRALVRRRALQNFRDFEQSEDMSIFEFLIPYRWLYDRVVKLGGLDHAADRPGVRLSAEVTSQAAQEIQLRHARIWADGRLCARHARGSVQPGQSVGERIGEPVRCQSLNLGTYRVGKRAGR